MRRILIVTGVSLALLAGGAVLQPDQAGAGQPAARAGIHQIGKAHTYQVAFQGYGRTPVNRGRRGRGDFQVAFQGYGRAPAAHTDQSSPNGNG